ncbi:hypothetical protein CHS0354_036253 [Potamilus streckersoni]|uniref:C-terminal of Roc (COR) domain-containing protein n=1 Tax=Potamilus streckersoni TaxID=2493646 RepID=A0AAE0W3B9_9BIVA|nr:hypothetical protein CHS0354_036253 [Potamilus streckersoni]
MDSREAVCQSYFQQIRYEYIGTKPTIIHLADEDFAIDNTVIDKKLDDLKKKIVQLASEQPYWGEAIPVRWLTLEEHLMSLKAAGVKVIPYSLLEEMNQKESVKIESKEELNLFLKFQHDVGNILYFGTEDLKDHITLDPQWLIYSLRTIITAENFILQKIKSPAIIQKWREFKKTGKLTQELIDAIWTKENNPDCHDNKDLILRLMEQLNIIARPQCFSEDGDQVKVENCFLAPCMLNQKTPIEVIYPVPHSQMESSSVICYVFMGKYLPSPIFHRLLAACVAYWPIATKMNKGTLENLIFCGCCVFQLDHYHKLTIHFRDYIIFLRVTRKGITDKTPSSKLCTEAREFVSVTLTKIIGCLGQSLKFEQFIQCPEYKGDSVNSLIPVSLLKENQEVCCTCHDNVIESDKLLRFWFDDKASQGDKGGETMTQNEVSDIPSECQKSPEGKGSDTATANIVPVLLDSSAPATKDVSTPAETSDLTPDTAPAVKDTDRFMHIACLLVNVGSRVLRRLLLYHTVMPGCTLDQYLANNRIDIDDLRKRKILNKSQIDILFPPGGSTNLADYDITLLSALFTNVVLTVSLQELNMIQFLRDKRNVIFAHAKSVAVNLNVYQTFWNDICRTLEVLSKQCNDPDFENEILKEIQGIKVSTVQGTSFLDALQACPRRIETLERLVQALISSQTQEPNKQCENNDL